MKKITTEAEYVKALEEINKLQEAKETKVSIKKLEDLYAIVEEYDGARTLPGSSRLEALREELADYTEEEVKIFSTMALQLLDYNKKVKQGVEATKPKFDEALYTNMRDWARLKAEIAAEEKQQA